MYYPPLMIKFYSLAMLMTFYCGTLKYFHNKGYDLHCIYYKQGATFFFFNQYFNI